MAVSGYNIFMEEFTPSKKKKNAPFIVMGSTFIFLLIISTLILINLGNLYNEKKSADIITLSEEIHNQMFDEFMKNLSKIFTVKGIVENSNASIPDYTNIFKELFQSTQIRDIMIAPDCIIQNVYPKKAASNLIGKSFLKDFPEILDVEDLCQKNTPVIFGPYEVDEYNMAIAAIAPVFVQRGPQRVFYGVVSVSVDFPQIVDDLNFDFLTKKDIAFKIWRTNNLTKRNYTLLESDTSDIFERTEFSKTFAKNYFSSTLFYTFAPSKIFYKTKAFYIIAICMLAFVLLLSTAVFYVVRGISAEEREKFIQVQSKLVETQEHTIFSLSNLVEYRDSDTGNHVKRTSNYVELIARKALEKGLYKEFLNEEYVQILRKAAPMHDIGKITIPDAILKKPGKLTADEFDIIKKHSVEGGRIVRDILGPVQTEEYTNIATQIATFHHEKWDGSGYPAGLSGEQIPLSARIMALADVFDALTTPRCYKEVYSFEKTLSIILEESGTHFDPQLVQLLVECQEDMRAIMIKFAE